MRQTNQKLVGVYVTKIFSNLSEAIHLKYKKFSQVLVTDADRFMIHFQTFFPGNKNGGFCYLSGRYK